MNIAITGVYGALGREVFNSLLNLGHNIYSIVRESTLNNSQEYFKLNSILSLKNLMSYRNIYQNQILTDLSSSDTLRYEKITFIGNSTKSLSALFETKKIDIVIHLSTNYGYDGNIKKVIADNLIFPTELLSISQKYSTPLFINTDTFFNKENLYYGKLKHYAFSKKAFLLWLGSEDRKNVITLRLEHTYGPNDRKEKFLSRAINDIAIKQFDFFKATNGDHKRDFIDVRDACSAFQAVVSNSEKIQKNIYEVGTGTATSIKNALEIIKKLSGSKTQILYGAIKVRAEDNYDSFANQDFKQDFNWKPQYSLEDGISNWLRVIERS